MSYLKCLLIALILSTLTLGACSFSTSSGTSGPSLWASLSIIQQGGQVNLVASGFRDTTGVLATGGTLTITSSLGSTIAACTLTSGTCTTTYTATSTTTGADQVTATYPGNSVAPFVTINVFRP